MDFSFIEIMIGFIMIYLLLTVMKLDARVKGLQYKLDQIAIQTNVSEEPIKEEVISLLHEGKDVKAVKRVRETLGLSLVEAKQYVDRLKSE